VGTETLQLPPHLQEVLDEAVRRIVEIARPEAIILFGSHAEGRAHERSDFDLLVIADTPQRRALTGELYEMAADLRHDRAYRVPSFDIIVMTPDEWRYESQLPAQLAFRAKRRGVTVHGRAA